MTGLLTKIAVGIVALFFVTVVVTASVLTSNKSADASSATKVRVPAEEKMDVASKQKRTIVHRSSLALDRLDEVENINFYGGRISGADNRFSPGRAVLKSQDSAIQFVER